MLRTILGALFVFAIAGFVTAEEKKADKKGTAVAGTFKSYEKDTLTLSVGKKGAEADKTFTVAGDTKAVVWDGEAKKDSTAGVALKDLKAGTRVAVMSADDKVTGIVVGMAPKKPAK